MNTVRSRLLTTSLVLVVATAATADDQIFRLGSAKPLRGTIAKMTKDYVELKGRSGPAEKVPADEIERIRFNAEAPQLNLARSSEQSGLLDRALENYTKLVGSLKGTAKADTEFLIARTQCRMAIADPEKIEVALTAMQAALAKHANSFRYYECLLWLGRVQMAKGDYAAAKSRFEAMGASPMKSHKMTAQVAAGRVLLAENKPAEAQTNFDAVVAMKPSTDAEKASRYDAVLGKARCQQLQSSFDAALKSLDDIVNNTNPNTDAELHARAFLQKGDCYRDQQKPKQAVMAYLRVELIYFRDQGAVAEALFRLSELHSQVGHPERGAEAKAKLRKQFPNNEWTRKLAG